jgi:transposase InsO family protein
MENRTALNVMEAIKFFTGRRKIQQAYSDNAPEFIKAVRCLNIIHETSSPGVPQTNGIIERVNLLIIGGTVTSLISAGLPPC